MVGKVTGFPLWSIFYNPIPKFSHFRVWIRHFSIKKLSQRVKHNIFMNSKNHQKTLIFDDFLLILEVFWIFLNFGWKRIMVVILRSFEFFWRPWHPWGRLSSGLNNQTSKTPCLSHDKAQGEYSSPVPIISKWRFSILAHYAWPIFWYSKSGSKTDNLSLESGRRSQSGKAATIR